LIVFSGEVLPITYYEAAESLFLETNSEKSLTLLDTLQDAWDGPQFSADGLQRSVNGEASVALGVGLRMLRGMELIQFGAMPVAFISS